MKSHKACLLALLLAAALPAAKTFADNPLILDQFTADPTARVFEGKIYLYPSHDIKQPPPTRGTGWFSMEDYHVFSTENLIDWTDHGMIISQSNVPWTNPRSYNMWAPDCIFRNGKYYFYFPAGAKTGGQAIGVAISDTPYGPFTPEATPIQGARGIDPNEFIDKDGQAYLYYAQGRIFVAKLKENMLELDSRPQVITNLPTRGTVEGPFLFERNGIYYLTYPHQVSQAGECLEYATSTSPTGPFTVKGVMMDQLASGCWTIHQSVVQYKDQWYLFYHDKDLSPEFDKNRSVRAEKMFFNDDGTIQKVVPTLRGIGIADAHRKIQIDRYSAVSSTNSAVDSFINPTNSFEGWKITLSEKGAWVRYNDVEFGKGDLKSVNVRAESSTGGQVEVHLDTPDGPLLAKVDIGKSSDWSIINAKLLKAPSGLHNLVVSLPDQTNVDIDWVSFE